MVSQPIMNSIPKAVGQNMGLGLKGTLHRNHYSAPSGGGGGGGGYHQHHHVYHMTDPGGYGHGHSEHGSGRDGKKKSIALSALTLLAFLFFLNILQNCIEDQMDDMSNTQFIVMTSRLQQLKEGQQALANAKSATDDSATGKTNDNKRNFEKIQSQRRADHFSNSNSFANITAKIITKNNNKMSRP